MTKPKPKFGAAASCVEVDPNLATILERGFGKRWAQNFYGPRVQAFCAEEGVDNRIRVFGRNPFESHMSFEIHPTINGESVGSMRIDVTGGDVPKPRPGKAPAPLSEPSDEAIEAAYEECGICSWCEGPFADVEPLWGHMLKVGWTKVKPQFRRQGLGLVMYELAWYLASALGCYLVSDTERSAFAERVWRGFIDKGFARTVLNDAYGVLYYSPHNDLYIDRQDIMMDRARVPGQEWVIDRETELDDMIDKLETARDVASEEEDEDLQERILEAHDEIAQIWSDLLFPHLDRVHAMHQALDFPEDDGDGVSIPIATVEITDDQVWEPNEPLQVGLYWPCWRYVLEPVQHVTAARRGLFGLGRTVLDQPTLPDDDAADFG